MPRFSLDSLYRWTLCALAETAVALPWMVLCYRLSDVPDWPAALPGAWLLLLAYGLAALWELGSPETARNSGQGRLAATAVGLTVIYLIAFYTTPDHFMLVSPLSLNVAMSVMPAAGYLWYQGAASGAEGVEYGRVFTRFGMQCIVTVAAVILLVWSGVSREAGVQVLLYWSLLLLFAAGLTLLVITRERSLRRDQKRLGESGSGGERMSGLLTAVVAGLVLMTLLASYLLSAERMHEFFALVQWAVGRPVSWALDVALLIIVRWAAMLGWLLQWIRGLFTPKGNIVENVQVGEGVLPLPPLPESDQPAPSGTDWVPYINVGLMVLGGLLLAAQMLRIRRRDADAAGDPEEHKVDLGLWPGLKADLKAWLGSLRQSSSDTARAEAQRAVQDDPLDPRTLFRRLQLWGVSIGRPRGLAETAARYGDSLAQRRPDAAAATEAVTEVYQRAKYGRTPPDPDTVSRAADALGRLQK